MPRTLQGLTHMDCKNAGWGGITYLMLASQWRSDHFNLEKSNKSKSQISEFLLLWFWCVHCGAANQPSSVDDYSHSVHEEEGAQGAELWGWSYFYFAWVNNTRNKKPRRQNSGKNAIKQHCGQSAKMDLQFSLSGQNSMNLPESLEYDKYVCNIISFTIS